MAFIPAPSATYSTLLSSGTAAPSLPGRLPSPISQPPASSVSGQQRISTLYIYISAFLVVLIAISSAITLHGVVFRRRWRRRVEAAIAAGELTPGDYRDGDVIALGTLQKCLGVRPDVYHVFLADGERSLSHKTVECLDKTKPFSVMFLPTSGCHTALPVSHQQQRPRSWIPNAVRGFRVPTTSSPSPPHSANHASPTGSSSPSSPSPPTSRTIQAAFFVSMPSPSLCSNRKSASAVDDASFNAEDDGYAKSQTISDAHDLSPVEIGVVSFILHSHAPTPPTLLSPSLPIPTVPKP
ncbi:hypothetical protein BD410DRAFT_835147 [Rickenella mellea]|uniref:Uncharacterized protein n=1 Tax=Rickenella mellea TaxID=50990 RepID=A0A4Y7QLS8_9AGAM|nr:hypothetical protein BD410DRAFT_835147 [Rickenella mellea]